MEILPLSDRFRLNFARELKSITQPAVRDYFGLCFREQIRLIHDDQWRQSAIPVPGSSEEFLLYEGSAELHIREINSSADLIAIAHTCLGEL